MPGGTPAAGRPGIAVVGAELDREAEARGLTLLRDHAYRHAHRHAHRHSCCRAYRHTPAAHRRGGAREGE